MSRQIANLVGSDRDLDGDSLVAGVIVVVGFAWRRGGWPRRDATVVQMVVIVGLVDEGHGGGARGGFMVVRVEKMFGVWGGCMGVLWEVQKRFLEVVSWWRFKAWQN